MTDQDQPDEPLMDPAEAQQQMAEVDEKVRDAQKAAAEERSTRLEDGDPTTAARERAEDNTDNHEPDGEPDEA